MYSVTVNATGGYGFDVMSDGQTVHVDAKGGAISPPAMLLAGLGSCVGVYIQKYAEGAKLDLGSFGVAVHADFTKEPPFRFQKIAVTIDLRGAAIDERRKSALLAFIRNCPVHNTLKTNPEVDVTIT